MTKLLLAGLIMLAVGALGGRPALAYGDAPWCAVTTGGLDVHWECEYNSIEACRPNVIAGNRGFCNPNPRYHGPVERSSTPHRNRRRH